MPYDRETDTYYTEAEWVELKKKRKIENRAKNRHDHTKVAAIARMKIGTDVGNKQRVQQFKEMLLTDKNGSMVINKILQIAMDDEHAGQAAALKMCIDRMLPSSVFEDKASGVRNAIQINITGIGESKVIEAEQ